MWVREDFSRRGAVTRSRLDFCEGLVMRQGQGCSNACGCEMEGRGQEVVLRRPPGADEDQVAANPDQGLLSAFGHFNLTCWALDSNELFIF